MLFIIDMQNDYIHREKGKRYVKDSEKLIDGIINKIRESKEKEEYIFYTSDIPIIENKDCFGENNHNDRKSIMDQEEKSNKEEEWACELYGALKPYLNKDKNIKKSYYAIPPESLLKLQDKLKEKIHIIKEIELVGVETHICVLANAICLQSAFPRAKILIHASLCKSKNTEDHENALKIMEGLGMEIRR